MVDFGCLTNKTCSDPFLSGPIVPYECKSIVSQCTLFLVLINTIVTKNQRISGSSHRIKPVKRVAPCYDFVVIGGGAAGAVVASRLSENRHWKVLLLEAGPDEPNAAQIPSNTASYLGTEIDWQFKTTNESYACLGQGGVCSWPRGKVLGGTTVHYGMAYHRGHPKDFEKWVAMGAQGWSWKEVFPYFLKSENNHEIKRVGTKHHATGGLMPIERFPWQPQFAWDILKAGDEMGYGITEDLVGDKRTGFAVAQTMSSKGVRVSSAASYLRPARHRRNLHVALNAIGTKIVFKRKKAVAVEYIMNGKVFSVKVKREVIVSSGAVNSPQILMLSGIGPQENLRSLNIPVVHNLPGVGENLQNHVSYGLRFTVNDNANLEYSSPLNMYLKNQTGPFSSTGLAQVMAILASKYTTPDYPDVQIFFSGYGANCWNSDTNSVKKITIRPVNLHARSRGRLTLASNNPLDHPIIWTNDLADPRDAKVLVWGIHVALSLVDSPTMQKLNLTLISTPIPECSDFEFKSDQYWVCAMRHETGTENHQGGSCKMGSTNDPMAVVDERLRVYGVKGVRVVDASSMPVMVSGNPVATITMMAERAVDFIREDDLLCYKP